MAMSDRLTKILLIDDDSIFRLGLRTALAASTNLEIVEADTPITALNILAEAENAKALHPGMVIALVVLELNIGRRNPNELTGLALCQQLKSNYPIPILLLTAESEPATLIAAQKCGVEGYCPKGVEIRLLIEVMHQLLSGQFYWQLNPSSIPINSVRPPSWHHKMCTQGLRQIEDALSLVNQQQNPNLSTLDWLYWSGRRRELLAARWLVNQLLPTALIVVETKRNQRQENTPSRLPLNRSLTRQLTSIDLPLSPISQPSTPFEATLEKLNSGLLNLTGVDLEIDILQAEKKQALLYIVLQKLERILEELHFSQVKQEQLPKKRTQILQDLWQLSITEFFGKYYTLPVGNNEFEVVQILLENAVNVQATILDKIPLVVELLAHQLFETALMIDNVSYPAKTPEALVRAENLLQNLIIQVANAVIGPLLNEFADLETIKQSFYDRRLISTREIARFRNNLSWRYRVSQLILEPRAIFESQYVLFILSDTGIKQISIYAPRRQELEQLQGIRLAVTLACEARDAVSPRLRSAVTWAGRGLVYVLTQVLGRSIGLVVRGVIQGIGSSLQDTRFGKNGGRDK
jgi:DNA-binding NarL/FixJ family response regulator